MNSYHEFPPPPALAAHVACFWSSRMAAAASHRVLPDNCIDILWQDRAPGGFVAGMMQTCFDVQADRPVETVAVRFLPGAARAFFELPLDQLTGQHVALAELWPRAEAEALAAALWEREQPARERIGILERHLLARLAMRPYARTVGAAMARMAVAAIERSGGEVRVASLADELGVSRQHLASQFREHVGLNAKLFARIARFQRANMALREGGGPDDWASFAQEQGYYDQSHLIHDFRAFAGRTPDSIFPIRG